MSQFVSRVLEWRRLESVSDRFLLYCLNTPRSSGYALYVTDLVDVWSDRADEAAVIRLAGANSSYPFDVTNESEVGLLLQYVRAGLESSGHESVAPDVRFDGDGNARTLTVVKTIPPIPTPMEWSFHLTRDADCQAILGGVSLGLLGAIDSLEAKIESLERLIHNKDYHIRSMRESLEQVSNPYKPRKLFNAYQPYEGEHEKNISSIDSPEDVISTITKGFKTAQPYWSRFTALRDSDDPDVVSKKEETKESQEVKIDSQSQFQLRNSFTDEIEKEDKQLERVPEVELETEGELTDDNSTDDGGDPSDDVVPQTQSQVPSETQQPSQTPPPQSQSQHLPPPEDDLETKRKKLDEELALKKSKKKKKTRF